jgi:hypothetical protein
MVWGDYRDRMQSREIVVIISMPIKSFLIIPVQGKESLFPVSRHQN